MDSNIESPKPNGMKNHMENIEPPGRRIELKMSSHLYHSPMHSYMLPWRYTHQYVLQVWNIFGRNLYRKWFPIQNITKRWHIVLGDKHRNTACVYGLNNPRARHFIPARAETKLAFPHHIIVWHTFWKVFVYLDVLVFVFPMLEKDWSDRTMNPSSKECQKWTFWWGGTANQALEFTSQKVDFGEGYVLHGVEFFRCVGVA